MILFPNCKINLGLHILQKRADGFHDLETVFYPFPLTDALEIVQSDAGTNSFSLSGLSLDNAPGENICVKAYDLLKKDFRELPPIRMHLHKCIPSGAGLGGGSADGAYTLLLLNKKFNLGLTEEALIRYALQLGSDCPFFILNTPCIARGRGEIMKPVTIELSAYRITLVNPGIHITTPWAFSQITPNNQRNSLEEAIHLPIESWKAAIINDFETPVFTAHPEIAGIKESMYQQGAVFASMSGSGSSVFGIFKKDHQPAFTFPEHYFIRSTP